MESPDDTRGVEATLLRRRCSHDLEGGQPDPHERRVQGKTYEDKGDIVTFDALRHLSFSHWNAMSGQADMPANYHLVTFDLAPEGEATKVTLSQANLMGGVTASDIEHRADYEKNWASVLDGLASVSMA